MSNIVIVDNEVEIIKVLQEFLSQQGYTVITALGGQKGLEICSSQTDIDLLILDLKMAKVNGIILLQALAEYDKKIPIIILSGTVGIEKYIADLEKLGYGYSDVVYKPVDLYELLDIVNKKLSA